MLGIPAPTPPIPRGRTPNRLARQNCVFYVERPAIRRPVPSETDLHSLLEVVLTREVRGVTGLVRAERLSGGASQETYRLTVETAAGPGQLCCGAPPAVARGSSVRPRPPGLPSRPAS